MAPSNELPKPQLDTATLFKMQSEAQTLLNLKAAVVSAVLIEQPSISFSTAAIELVQKLLNHLTQEVEG